jgi:hypothetical protein
MFCFKVTADFKEDVQNLPDSLDVQTKFVLFIEKYGTHYISKIVMGAKAVIQDQVFV